MRRVSKILHDHHARILGQVADLAENMSAYSKSLEDFGYRSFLAWGEFEAAFCEGNELRLHKRCLIDRTKRRVRTPDGLLRLRGESALPVESDPCIKRLSEMKRDNFVSVNERREKMHERFIAYRAEEVKNLATGRHNSRTTCETEYNSYEELYKSVLVDVFRPHGFLPDEFRSEAKFPVVSKHLTDDWDLCWSPESNRTLLRWPRKRSEDIRKMSELDLRCYVRSRGARGFAMIPIGFEALDIMAVRVPSLVDGFEWAYSRFNGIEELQTVLSAHGFLYGFVATSLEEVLTASLTSLR